MSRELALDTAFLHDRIFGHRPATTPRRELLQSNTDTSNPSNPPTIRMIPTSSEERRRLSGRYDQAVAT